MRGMNKKILISLLTTLVVFITVFATTYAWVGIFTYANTDSFKMNLKVQDLDSNYFLTISSSGEPGTFKNEVPAIELKRQMISAKYGDKYEDLNDNAVNSIFDGMNILTPITPIIDNSNISSFEKINLKNKYTLEFVETTEYLKFDLYLSVDTKEGINDNTTGIKANIYLNDIGNCLEGVINDFSFTNKNPFLDLPSSSTNDFLKTIPDTFKINTKNATRFALECYEPISIDSQYNDETPIMTRIFQGGSQLPSYEKEADTYDLGGILPEEQNTALLELLYIRENYKKYSNLELFNSKFGDSLMRNDLELIESNSMLWNKREHDSYLGCMDGIQTKMKISVYYWFEGWDADCIRSIDSKSVTLNLSFTSGTDD